MEPEKDPTGPSGLTKASTLPPENVTDPVPTYLTGVRLFLVMVALMLGMFLVGCFIGRKVLEDLFSVILTMVRSH